MALFYIIILFVFIRNTTCFKLLQPDKGCLIAVKDSKIEFSPLVFNPQISELMYPSNGIISLKSDQEILIGCPGTLLSHFNTVTATGKCVSGTLFLINGTLTSIDDWKCEDKVKETIRYTGKVCQPNGKEIEIGFEFDNTRFIRHISICFDDKASNALYASYKITKYIGNSQTGTNRPNFKQDTFYPNLKLNKLYTKVVQRSSINTQIGLQTDSTEYIKANGDFFLSRGHLAPRAAFFYASQQNATFHYVNAAPQWQTFNGGNWAQIETSVRKYAEANNVDLEVLTGTYEICTLPHSETGLEVPVYLYSTTSLIPVPKLYWKLVYEPIGKRGVVLLGINNPYIDSEDGYVVCKDVSSQLDWLSWSPRNVTLGYAYACELDEFKKVVDFLPDLQVNGLLEGNQAGKRSLKFLMIIGLPLIIMKLK